MSIEVFIQNEAGSNRKNYHDEKTLMHKFAKEVSRRYPYPYGFIIGTTAKDGDNLDCFVITNQALHCGQIVKCQPIGIMEQIEDGLEDHNVLAAVSGENVSITEEIKSVLVDFVLNVFGHVQVKQMRLGRFLGTAEAEAYIALHCDRSQQRKE